MTTKRVNINLTKSIHDALEQEAARRDVPMAQIVRTALALYLERYGHAVDPKVNWGGDRHTATAQD